MITKVPSIYNLISPCKIKESQRQQVFINSAEGSYQGGNGEIRFQVPNQGMGDFTESYIDALISLNTTDVEVPTIYELDLSGATGGEFILIYGHSSSAALDPTTVTSSDIEDALNGMKQIGGYFYDVSVTTSSANVYDISVSNFDNYGNVFGKSKPLLFQELSTTGLTLPLTRTSIGSFAYPRLEHLNPIVRSIRVDVGSTTPVNITDANILTSLITLTQVTGASYGQYNEGGRIVNGFHSSSQFRIKIELPFLDILRQFLPLGYINDQIILYLSLERNNKALVQSSTGGGTYTVNSPRFHYHRCTLQPETKNMIIERIQQKGLVIPFQNWEHYTTSIGVGDSSKTITLNNNFSDLLAIFFVMVPNSYVANEQNSNKYSTFLRNRIGAYRIKIGSLYYPSDQIDSVAPGNNDMVEPITELEHALSKIKHISDVHYDRELYFNYVGKSNGNDPTDFFYNSAYDENRPLTWAGGISVADSPHDRYGQLCKTAAMSGQNTNNIPVDLELQDMSLSQTNTIHVWMLHQDYLVIKPDGVTWLK